MAKDHITPTPVHDVVHRCSLATFPSLSCDMYVPIRRHENCSPTSQGSGGELPHINFGVADSAEALNAFQSLTQRAEPGRVDSCAPEASVNRGYPAARAQSDNNITGVILIICSFESQSSRPAFEMSGMVDAEWGMGVGLPYRLHTD